MKHILGTDYADITVFTGTMAHIECTVLPSNAGKVEYLKQEQEEVREKTRDLYDRKDEAREKFLNMHEYNKQKESEIFETESRLE